MEPTRHFRRPIPREAIRCEGYDPDDPKVIAALDRVRAELADIETREGFPRRLGR